MSVSSFSSDVYSRRCEETLIKAVVFEPSGVLYDATPRRRWLWQLITRLGLKLSYDDFIRPWDNLYLPPVLCGQETYCQAMHAFLASLGVSRADLSEVEAAMPLRGHPLEAAVRPLPGVARILSRVSNAGLQIAALCDCSSPGSELKEQLDQLGLGRLFSAVVTSIDLGSVKPTEQNYEAVEAATRCSAAECVMVSSRAIDLTGAAARGWRTISFSADMPQSADACVLSVTQMMQVLSSWTAAKLPAVA